MRRVHHTVQQQHHKFTTPTYHFPKVIRRTRKQIIWDGSHGEVSPFYVRYIIYFHGREDGSWIVWCAVVVAPVSVDHLQQGALLVFTQRDGGKRCEISGADSGAAVAVRVRRRPCLRRAQQPSFRIWPVRFPFPLVLLSSAVQTVRSGPPR